jgi:dihydrolipoamide dehydrogenase
LRDAHHLKCLGIEVRNVSFDRSSIASHANNMVSKLRGDMTKSLKRLGVDVLVGWGKMAGPQKVTVETEKGEKNCYS